MASDEVVQLYLTHVGVAGAPRRTLQGFQRIHLSPGARTAFEVATEQRSRIEGAGRRTSLHRSRGRNERRLPSFASTARDRPLNGERSTQR